MIMAYERTISPPARSVNVNGVTSDQNLKALSVSCRT